MANKYSLEKHEQAESRCHRYGVKPVTIKIAVNIKKELQMLLTPQIRTALKNAAALDPHERVRGMSTARLEAIDNIIADAKFSNPELFYDDVIVKGQGWVGKR